jgi:predicted GNAT superfamily acetyltransferase
MAFGISNEDVAPVAVSEDVTPRRWVIRDLTTHDEFVEASELEGEVWAYDDRVEIVPPALFGFAVRYGAVLIGAFDGGRLVGCAYTFPGIKNGTPIQVGYILGVKKGYRRSGLGFDLHREVGRRGAASGAMALEGTFDPLHAGLAELYFSTGLVGIAYRAGCLGPSSSALDDWSDTDRLVTRWTFRDLPARDVIAHGVRVVTPASRLKSAPIVLTGRMRDGVLSPTSAQLRCDDTSLVVEIPCDLAATRRLAPAVARQWRAETRTAFSHYLARGYHVTGYVRDASRGRYLLTKSDVPADASCEGRETDHA